mmetsp:Transcript_23773/g.59484  ORF Transcript_23773/g.59484 Transcript_23773/m.59484 type:complete len:312 (+) Transcript_23773:1476-2411(+)
MRCQCAPEQWRDIVRGAGSLLSRGWGCRSWCCIHTHTQFLLKYQREVAVGEGECGGGVRGWGRAAQQALQRVVGLKQRRRKVQRAVHNHERHGLALPARRRACLPRLRTAITATAAAAREEGGERKDAARQRVVLPARLAQQALHRIRHGSRAWAQRVHPHFGGPAQGVGQGHQRARPRGTVDRGELGRVRGCVRLCAAAAAAAATATARCCLWRVRAWHARSQSGEGGQRRGQEARGGADGDDGGRGGVSGCTSLELAGKACCNRDTWMSFRAQQGSDVLFHMLPKGAHQQQRRRALGCLQPPLPLGTCV